MLSLLKRSSWVLLALLILPAAAYAQTTQGAITGVARDTSGGVLPGVTVEIASPALIEKVRSVVTDDAGQYRVVELRPGTYSVTFTLPGFSTVRRDGIELTGSFVATVNGDLRVGALEETITVTGETPIVDVQSVKVQQTVSNDVIRAIPSSRSAGGIQSLIPGMSTGGDSGGITGGGGSAGSIHGGRGQDSRTYSDGLNIGWAGGGGGQWGNMVNVAAAQELVLSTSGGLGEAETGGVSLNAIPREGGNTYSGAFVVNGANGAMQGSNYTDSLKAQGLQNALRAEQHVRVQSDGRRPHHPGQAVVLHVVSSDRDRQHRPRHVGQQERGQPERMDPRFRPEPAGLFGNAGPDCDRARHVAGDAAQQDQRQLAGAEVSAQLERRRCGHDHDRSDQPRLVRAVTAAGRHLVVAVDEPDPSGSRLGHVPVALPQSRPAIDGTHNPRMIRAQDQAGEIPNLVYRMPAGVGGGFNHHLIGTKANNRASISFVTGAHNMKFGYQGGFSNPSQTYQYFNEINFVRLRDAVPNQLRQVITVDDSDARIKVVRNLWPTSFYAQDQWTNNRLTLQGGIRYDWYLANYPESKLGGPGYTASIPNEIVYPSRSTQGISWQDVTPRMGVAYDLFGDGRTALKFNLGKYMQANSAANNDLDLNPIIRTAISTTRVWTDTNKDFVANCVLTNPEKNGECAAMDNKNLGKEVFDRTYDPSFTEAWGSRVYNWGLGVSVQQEVAPRVSLNVGYYRNWWGNWYTVDNRANQLSDWTPFSITAPVDPRLPGGGGQVIPGLYNLVPGAVGAVDEWATNSRNYAEQSENWHGVDVGISARLRNGLTLQGGTSTGRRLSDACALKAALPEQGTGTRGDTSSIAGGSPVNPWCRTEEPYRTDFRGLASYTIPKIDLQVSGTWRFDAGPELAANYVVTSAVAREGGLGRDLSAGNVTVNLIEPGTFYADYRPNVDIRVAKIFRYGRTRTQVGFDVYNLTNTDVVTTYNQTFSPTSTTWLTPTAIQPARYAKISAQFDF